MYPVLTELASDHNTIRYPELRDIIQFGGIPYWLGKPLGRVATYCHRNGLPILNVIAINKSGAPGSGIPFVENHLLERERVFAFDWHSVRSVSSDDFLEPGCLSA